jgi:hypothetical protein
VVGEHRRLLELAADADIRDLGSDKRVRSMDWPKNAVPASGRVLPVITSIIVVLPAPLGPITQRSSPASMVRLRSFNALEAVEAHRHRLDVQDAAVARVDTLRDDVPVTDAAPARRRRVACGHKDRVHLSFLVQSPAMPRGR